jgi:hypothetical protein
MLAVGGLVVTAIEPPRRRPMGVAAALLAAVFAVMSFRIPDPIATAIAERYPGRAYQGRSIRIRAPRSSSDWEEALQLVRLASTWG